MTTSLKSSEWFSVITLLLTFAAMVAIAKVNAFRSAAHLETEPPSLQGECAVRIEGAVERPGIYRVPRGAPLQQALAKSHPKRNANLKKFDRGMPIEVSTDLYIEEILEIQVHVRGEGAQEATLTLPFGARLCDAKLKIDLCEEADLTIFKSRRLLKDGEILEVKKKEVAENKGARL